jgi:putative oxidoreductase
VWDSIFKDKLAPLALRITLGIICIHHGFLKIMASGGTNWYPPLPAGWQLIIAWAEFSGGVAILLGFRCRLSTALVLVVTTGTLLWLQGWTLLRSPVRSLESPFMLLMVAIALLCLGAGEMSVDGGGLRLVSAKASKRR